MKKEEKRREAQNRNGEKPHPENPQQAMQQEPHHKAQEAAKPQPVEMQRKNGRSSRSHSIRKNKEEDGKGQPDHQPTEKRRGRLECGTQKRREDKKSRSRRTVEQRIEQPQRRNKGGVTTGTVGAAASQRTETTPYHNQGKNQEEE